MSNLEYITYDELKNVYASKLSSITEHKIINESLSLDGINSIKNDYLQLTMKTK